MLKSEKRITIKSRGKVLQIVREQYLRDDIPCKSGMCNLCEHDKDSSCLSSDATHYVIPTADLLYRYFEILDREEVRNVVFLQTVIVNLLQVGGRKSYNKIRSSLRDGRLSFVFFPNEYHKETFRKRKDNETSNQHIFRCIYNTALWYKNHLKSQNHSVSIVILTENVEFIRKYGTRDESVFLLSLGEYLNKFLSYSKDIIELYDNVHQSLKDCGSSGQNFYPEHLNSSFLENGMESGKFLQGLMKVRRYHVTKEAFVSVSESSCGHSVVLIRGTLHRNRAVHGDNVVIELLPKSEWKGKIVSLDDADSEENVDESSTIPTGKVVGILQRNWRDYIATFNPNERFTSRKSGDRTLVIPYDRRIPKIRITTRQGDQLQSSRIVVRMDSWPADSHYPSGHFVKTIGEIGRKETETSTILIEHGVNPLPFSASILAELPGDEETWCVDATEVKKRRDLRESHFIFSIDPAGCEDVDDALSVTVLSNGWMQLGVHIADVSYFVKTGSLCDMEARNRSTTIYLADRRFDMLPEALSANICSLLSRVDRYAVSILWTMDEDFQIRDVWYGRTAIRSSYKLFYEIAQDIIDGGTLGNVESGIAEFSDLSDEEKRREYVRLKRSLDLLTTVGRHFRDRRLKCGGLELDSVEVQFESEENEIKEMKLKVHLEIHEIVAECMILANHWTAKKIYGRFPHNAMLRRHPKPKKENLDALVSLANLKGFVINTESNQSLAKSLNRCVDENDPYVNVLFRRFATLAMPKAIYFSTGSVSSEDYFHYGLALDYYTHFTSPIRRYADVIVHRLLLCTVGESKTCDEKLFGNSFLQDVASHVNERSIAAQNAQRESLQLHQVLYFKKNSRKMNLVLDAIIFDIKSNGFLVYVPEYGINGPVYLLNKDKNVLWVKNNGSSTLTEWIDGTVTFEDHKISVNTGEDRQSYQIFDHVSVRITFHTLTEHADKLRLELVDNRSRGFERSQKVILNPAKLIVEDDDDVLADDKKTEKFSFYQMLTSFRNLALDGFETTTAAAAVENSIRSF